MHYFWSDRCIRTFMSMCAIQSVVVNISGQHKQLNDLILRGFCRAYSGFVMAVFFINSILLKNQGNFARLKTTPECGTETSEFVLGWRIRVVASEDWWHMTFWECSWVWQVRTQNWWHSESAPGACGFVHSALHGPFVASPTRAIERVRTRSEDSSWSHVESPQRAARAVIRAFTDHSFSVSVRARERDGMKEDDTWWYVGDCEEFWTLRGTGQVNTLSTGWCCKVRLKSIVSQSKRLFSMVLLI